MTRRKVTGHCPACGAQRLAVNPTGTLVCCAELCTRPTAAAELLANLDIAHVVEIQTDDFTLRHPLAERLDDALFDCGLHAAIAASNGPPAPPGRYRVHVREQALEFDPLPAATSPRTTKETEA